MRTKKGQAAITDALFFLLIIVTLSVLMFRYSSTYGDRIDQASSDLYYKEYTNSVLKTIFYTSVPLDFDLNLYSEVPNDYLMTQIKQDYYASGKIGISDINQLSENYIDIPKYNLFHVLKATMKPLESYDYLFYLYNGDDLNFIYFSIKNTNFTPGTQSTGIAAARGIMDYNLDTDNPYSYYLCDPDTYDDVRAVVSRSSKIFSSSIPLVFTYNYSHENVIGYKDDIRIIATFAMWPATVDINSTILEALNCNEVVGSVNPDETPMEQ